MRSQILNCFHFLQPHLRALAPQTPIGRRILIAWKGVREAARALRDAWPLIERADEVAVVMVGDVAADEVEQIRGRFARHGRNVEVFVEKEQDARAPEALRARVEDWKADLLVMGLYGRPRLAELVLGGVSREMIARAPCNLFVSH